MRAKAKMKYCQVNLGLLWLLAGCLVWPMATSATPLEQHMQRMLTNGDEWRTPNPGYQRGQDVPEAFGLTFELAEDRSHVTGQLTGIHDDGRRAVYWTLLAMYNPVTERVITQQIGWNGAYLYGEIPVQPGPVQVVDMTHFKKDGTLDYSRHENRFESQERHISLVYAPDGQGGWKQTQAWEWRRHPVRGEPESDSAQNAAAKLAPALVDHVAFLVAGSGRWRTVNPAFEPGSDLEQFYEMHYRLGPHGQHVRGEIVSVYEDGRAKKNWTFFITHNPVTSRTWMEQTGPSGVYFRGQLESLEGGRRLHGGIVYMPNGQAKSVRDEIDIIDEQTWRSNVFDRKADGSWEKAREWIWRLQPADGESN